MSDGLFERLGSLIAQGVVPVPLADLLAADVRVRQLTITVPELIELRAAMRGNDVRDQVLHVAWSDVLLAERFLIAGDMSAIGSTPG